MSYVVGQYYKHVRSMKRGLPVYEDTTVAGIFPDKIRLSNGAEIDYVPLVEAPRTITVAETMNAVSDPGHTHGYSRDIKDPGHSHAVR